MLRIISKNRQLASLLTLQCFISFHDMIFPVCWILGRSHVDEDVLHSKDSMFSCVVLDPSRRQTDWTNYSCFYFHGLFTAHQNMLKIPCEGEIKCLSIPVELKISSYVATLGGGVYSRQQTCHSFPPKSDWHIVSSAVNSSMLYEFLGTDLEEALHAAGRVFGSGSVVTVRQQNHHPTLQQPLSFTCSRPTSKHRNI